MKNKKLIIGFIVISVIIVILVSIKMLKKDNKTNINISDFEIVFNENINAGKQHIKSNIYTYNGDVTIKIGKDEYSLKEALEKGIITEDKIIEKAKEICINSGGWNDGESMQYDCNSFIIIKYNTLLKNKDFYIGNKDLTYSIGEKE